MIQDGDESDDDAADDGHSAIDQEAAVREERCS